MPDFIRVYPRHISFSELISLNISIGEHKTQSDDLRTRENCKNTRPKRAKSGKCQ